ncbi:DUF3027 domain-containing protein [Paramicrobacterium sp. CJ85]|uniref:DUF3027 domain-containing protein n=1 Tax=Paramicrobacterium sp. CJ85 TaxID=3445355 RepID=UPI003F5F11D2
MPENNDPTKSETTDATVREGHDAVTDADKPTTPVEDASSKDAPQPAEGDAPDPESTAPESTEPETPTEPDPVLLAAVDLAREALLEGTTADTIGDFAGHKVEQEHVLSLLFENRLDGYPGWLWTVTLARVEDGEPTVVETELMPGDSALLAPDWVPWSERLAEYRAQQEEAAREAAEAEEDDESDDDEDDDSLLHAGDLDGVDVDELDEASHRNEDDADDSDDESSDSDESEDSDDSDEDDSNRSSRNGSRSGRRRRGRRGSQGRRRSRGRRRS